MKNFLFFINHVENSISKTLVYYFLLISVAVSSFFIGATSNLIENRGGMEIKNLDGTNYEDFNENKNTNITGINTESISNSITNQNKDKSIIFASVKGKYFYYKGCGGESIAKKNLRYYKTEAEAIKAGKKIYKNCE